IDWGGKMFTRPGCKSACHTPLAIRPRRGRSAFPGARRRRWACTPGAGPSGRALPGTGGTARPSTDRDERPRARCNLNAQGGGYTRNAGPERVDRTLVALSGNRLRLCRVAPLHHRVFDGLRYGTGAGKGWALLQAIAEDRQVRIERAPSEFRKAHV